MVLGLRSRHRKGTSVKVNYIVNVQEIRPWPPLESPKSAQTVLLQWESGNQYSGSLFSTAQGSKIVFNESFKLPLILYQDKKAHNRFQKNYLEFSLFVPRKDKAKGQLLGTAIINLADYGVIEHITSISASVNLKKSSNNLLQPALIVTLEPVEKDSSSSSPNVGLSKEASFDNDELEIASFTDDEASSHSSRTGGSSTFEAATSSPSLIEKNGNRDDEYDQEENRTLLPSSTDASPDMGSHVNENISFSRFYERSTTYVKKNPETTFIRSSQSSISFHDINEKPNTVLANCMQKDVPLTSHEVIPNSKCTTTENTQKSVEEKSSEGFSYEALSADNSGKDTVNSNSANSLHSPASQEKELQPEDVQINDANASPVNIGEQSDDQITAGELSDFRSEWKTRIQMLEEELREAAAAEIGLYSIIAEHASSVNKVHAPARRLSRFYSNACKAGSQVKRATAARAAVSGLVLVSKSCGNDVPRLTFWLSNVIMLRAIVSQIAAELQCSNRPESKMNGTGPELTGRLPHKRADFSHVEGDQSKSNEEPEDWEDVWTFILALENVESWLFSRIVESVWWQTFTPHMQCTVAKSNGLTSGSDTKKICGRRNSMSNHEQSNFSMELWKKAFKDACERLCPIRAGGHDCGCLSVLVRLVMEELVNRLDVAMFNAVLRESAEEMPTDPLSDPISDSKVLPILPGKSSFGAGVELKNAIGNWSRWLTDLFGLDDDSIEHSDILGDGKKPESFKAFRLLHSLSDLMMLPFGMLADASTRKEVCPMLGPTIIKRVLDSFVPDEFCPDPLPQDIIEALDIEEDLDSSGDLLTSFPCTASPTKYTPPPAALLTCAGEVGSQVLQSSRLSTLRKSYTSDDELDELDSPFTAIIPDSFQSSALAKLSLIPKEKGGRNVLRYQLLREIWKDDE
ncbi:uncharacterized protein LOC105156693 isoform X1 [Sesamum indicum]|uniref:Uncharacterized protein LOC105156693 isoform X1 n=1 Tax=Sesamum indicum TaxID=4182 RepID=A0A6I9SPU5_SESIN|nr:uncharacterized protein LOC105156693 isoform X1 [Sesamum indicum]XP_011071209.1 uncharacterized protein LOC105156693 isoform X1 [Sesamum indicum]